MLSKNVNGILRTIVSHLQTPVVMILLLLMIATVIIVGAFICEFLMEHRKFREDIPELIEKIRKAKVEDVGQIINQGKLLERQKKALLKLLEEKEMEADTRETYAAQVLFDEEEHYNKYLRWPQMISRISPMFGLLGTLIPLGPGLMALGKGNTSVLSQSLLVAFDTTSAGIIIAAVALIVFQMRKQWYRTYAQSLESIMEVILEKMKTGGTSC